MKYLFMLAIAFIMAVLSAIMTAFGMAELFTGIGSFILILFFTIDMGRFLLFNFTVDEWNNLRKIKYFIAFILGLLFMYSAVGVFSKLSSLVSEETKQAMVNTVQYNKAVENAQTKQNRSEDLASIAKKEYEEALAWNKNDLANCLRRAGGNANAENRCNNTKRALDNKASNALKEALANADATLENIENTAKSKVENQSEVANVIMTICKLTQKDCTTYDSLQNALTIIIILVIIGIDYLQIAIILAVNTRKNKKKKLPEPEQLIEETKQEPVIKKLEPIINNAKISTENTSINKIKEEKIPEPVNNSKEKLENIKKPLEKKVVLAKKDLSTDKLKKVKDITKKIQENITKIDKKRINFGPRPH